MIRLGNKSIIVGLADSPASRTAYRWAAEHARTSGITLRAVHVLEWPIGLTAAAVKSGLRLRVPEHEVSEPYLHGMRRVFDEIACPRGSVLQFAQGNVAEVLVRLSTSTSLLVVGTSEPIRQRHLDSVGHYCISRAPCPVVTVPAFRTRHDGDSWTRPDHAVLSARWRFG